VADRRIRRAEDLHRAEHRPLRASRAERGGPLSDGLGERLANALLMRDQALIALVDVRRAHAPQPSAGEKALEPTDHELRHVLPVLLKQVLAVDVDVEARLVRQRAELALDVVRHALLDDEHAALAP